MKSKILFLLMVLSIAFSSCKKDQNENPGSGSILTSGASSSSGSTSNSGASSGSSTTGVSSSTGSTSASPGSSGTLSGGASISDGTYSGKLIITPPTGPVAELDSILVTLQSGQFKSISSGYDDCGAGTFIASSTSVSFSDQVAFSGAIQQGQVYPWGVAALGGTYSFTIKGDSLLLTQNNGQYFNTNTYKLKKQ